MVWDHELWIWNEKSLLRVAELKRASKRVGDTPRSSRHGKGGKSLVPLNERKEWPKQARLAHGECRFFVEGKACQFGSTCYFAHACKTCGKEDHHSSQNKCGGN